MVICGLRCEPQPDDEGDGLGEAFEGELAFDRGAVQCPAGQFLQPSPRLSCIDSGHAGKHTRDNGGCPPFPPPFPAEPPKFGARREKGDSHRFSATRLHFAAARQKRGEPVFLGTARLGRSSNGVSIVNTVQSLSHGGYLGVKERQEREREATARSILDAARELFVAEGYPNVSIRKIAERIEYSPAAIYSYFPSKDDIFYSLAEEGFRLLASTLGADAPAGSVLDAVRRSFCRLYEFSKQHPEYYALMFLDRSVPRISRDWERFAFVHQMRENVTALIQRAIDEGIFPKETRPQWAFTILIASVQGASVMRLCERVAAGVDPDALAHDTLEAALTGLRTGFPATFEPGPCVPESDQ